MKFANTRPDLSLKQLVVLFLDNTRVRFGYQSSEVAAIESALRAFQNGQISKRDAFSSMVVTLDHHEGLKQDLWNVLFHEDARWADGDFDLVQLAPQFLEPAHQPRFRLPHLTPWFPDRTRTRPAEPTGTDHLPTSNYVWPPVSGDTALLHHQEDWNDHPQPSTSSPISQWASQSLDPVVAAVQPVRDWRQGQTEGSETAASSHLGMHEDLQSTQDYGNWDESSNFSDSLIKTGPLAQPAQPIPIRPVFFQIPQDWRLDPFVPEKDIDKFADSRTFEVSDQSSFDTSLQATRRYQEDTVKTEETYPYIFLDRGEEDRTIATGLVQDIQLEHLKPELRDSKPKLARERSIPSGGCFIHSLCGKGFATRSRVKKHHWGVKNDDLETKTGCWAKHKKPGVSWDDHISCRIETVKILPSEVGADSSPVHTRRAPEVPGKDPSKIIPALPTLEHLPDTIARTLASGNDVQHGWNLLTPSHLHRTSGHSAFDRLLSAANAAAGFNSSMPQVRNDSLFSQSGSNSLSDKQAGAYHHIENDNDGTALRAGVLSYVSRDRDHHLEPSIQPTFGGPTAYTNPYQHFPASSDLPDWRN